MNQDSAARRLCGALLFLSLTLPGCGAASFDTPFTMYTSVVSTDLNGDGRPDIAMASSYISGSPPHAGNAVILLQSTPPGDGFTPASLYATGNDSQAILAGDINGDGRPDLVVSNVVTSADNNGTNSVSILLQIPGNPGVFGPSSNYAAGQSPALASGDIDGDGLPDLVVGTTRNPAGVSLYAQSRTSPGVFEPPVRIASVEGVAAVAVGDVDRNGTQDICVATTTGLVVLLQDGSVPGAFLPAARYGAGSQPIAIAMGDLDGDGFPDLVVANYGSPDGQIRGGISVFLQDPSTPGKFLPATGYATGLRSISVAIGDLDDDGVPDIAVANPVSSAEAGNISILLQAPGHTGFFQPAVTYAASFQPLSVAIADLNGDGKADVVAADEGAIVYYQDPERPGVFKSPVRVGP